jgi:hypothetical protein
MFKTSTSCKLHCKAPAKLRAVGTLASVIVLTTYPMIIWTFQVKENCTVTVEFSSLFHTKNYTLFLRYSQMKVVIANLDSNLVTLKLGAESEHYSIAE